MVHIVQVGTFNSDLSKTYTVTVASAIKKTDSSHRYNGQGSGNAYLIDGIQAPILTLTLAELIDLQMIIQEVIH